MVRFSCFSSTPAPSHHHGTKKAVQHPSEAMQYNPPVTPQDQAMKSPAGSASSNPIVNENKPLAFGFEQNTSPTSQEDCWKSDELNSNSFLDDHKEFLQTGHMKKSWSLGNMLEKESDYAYDVHEDDDTDKVPVHFYDRGIEKGTAEHFNEEQHDGSNELSNDHFVNSNPIRPMIERSRSVNLRSSTATAVEFDFDCGSLGPRSRSLGNLHSRSGGKFDNLNCDEAPSLELISHGHSLHHGAYRASNLDGKVSPVLADAACNETEDEEVDDKCWNPKSAFGNVSSDGVLPYYVDPEDKGHHPEHIGPEVDWRGPEEDGSEIGQSHQRECFNEDFDCLTMEGLNIKRIEDWINQIDIENGTSVEEMGESSTSASQKDHQPTAVVGGIKVDSRISLGMELAYNYISTLNPGSSVAQLANLGLVAIPILSAFVGLRVLDLSRNSIVRITAGALPKGLHILNLSKNSISSIEGLRELTRLRLLDLSYNRMSRIGHGLASCSSLKELYLAGNKISEVEGLHRLLKLKILDLRFNKISTSKGLGQLAANYSSLEAVNLEGNPAQKNVGNEHLKKYLLSLLPHLVYYNHQTVRASGSKEGADRHSRIISKHRGEHSARSGHNKPSARSSAVAPKLQSSHHQDRQVRAIFSSFRPSSSQRHVPLPPMGSTKPTEHLPNNLGRRLLGSGIDNPIRRIRSEGTL